jgi:hypothetical protein
MRHSTITRPVTVSKLAESLGRKPYELIAELIPMGIFLATSDGMDESVAVDISAAQGVVLEIIGDDEEPGSSVRNPTSPKPDSPSGEVGLIA